MHTPSTIYINVGQVFPVFTRTGSPVSELRKGFNSSNPQEIGTDKSDTLYDNNDIKNNKLTTEN